MLIINPRGNNGSGKTYLTRSFMALAVGETKVVVQTEDKRQKIYGYQFEIPDCKHPWMVMGSYESTCGGCDTIHSMDEVIELVQYAVDDKFNVWLEGILLSDNYGRVGAYSEQFKDKWVFAYLNTPSAICLQRIWARRSEAGNTKEFDPNKTLMPRHVAIERSRAKVLALGRRVIDLDWEVPLPPLLAIIRKEG